jgi:hypothetical protein
MLPGRLEDEHPPHGMRPECGQAAPWKSCAERGDPAPRPDLIPHRRRSEQRRKEEGQWEGVHRKVSFWVRLPQPRTSFPSREPGGILGAAGTAVGRSQTGTGGPPTSVAAVPLPGPELGSQPRGPRKLRTCREGASGAAGIQDAPGSDPRPPRLTLPPTAPEACARAGSLAGGTGPGAASPRGRTAARCTRARSPLTFPILPAESLAGRSAAALEDEPPGSWPTALAPGGNRSRPAGFRALPPPGSASWRACAVRSRSTVDRGEGVGSTRRCICYTILGLPERPGATKREKVSGCKLWEMACFCRKGLKLRKVTDVPAAAPAKLVHVSSRRFLFVHYCISSSGQFLELDVTRPLKRERVGE